MVNTKIGEQFLFIDHLLLLVFIPFSVSVSAKGSGDVATVSQAIAEEEASDHRCFRLTRQRWPASASRTRRASSARPTNERDAILQPADAPPLCRQVIIIIVSRA